MIELALLYGAVTSRLMFCYGSQDIAERRPSYSLRILIVSTQLPSSDEQIEGL